MAPHPESPGAPEGDAAIDVERLGGELGPYTIDQARAVLERYRAGASLETTCRETRIPRHRIAKWVKLMGLARSRSEVAAMQRAALDRVRPGPRHLL